MSDSTYIDSGLKLRGLLKAPGQLVVIAGTFEGELEARDLIIEAGGHCRLRGRYFRDTYTKIIAGKTQSLKLIIHLFEQIVT